jgi:hypothetical protein
MMTIKHPGITEGGVGGHLCKQVNVRWLLRGKLFKVIPAETTPILDLIRGRGGQSLLKGL